jgi:hypothetical protein
VSAFYQALRRIFRDIIRVSREEITTLGGLFNMLGALVAALIILPAVAIATMVLALRSVEIETDFFTLSGRDSALLDAAYGVVLFLCFLFYLAFCAWMFRGYKRGRF